MNRKELLRDVFQSYNSIKDKMAREAANAQEEARSKAIEYEEKVKREKFEAERKLAETGVIDLLIGIRDSGLVMYRKKDNTPAELLVEGNCAKLTFDFKNEENFKYVKAYLEGEVLVVEGKEKCFVKNFSLIGNIMGQVLAFPKIEEKTRFDEWDHY